MNTMTMIRASLCPLVLLAAVSFAGCGSTSSKDPAPVNPDAGQEPAPTGVTFSLLVVTPLPGFRGMPVPGATVIFDKPGGERVEVTAGTDGVAQIPGVDWSKGKASFTILAENYTLASIVELDEAYVKGPGAVYAPKVAGDPKHDLTFYVVPLASAFKTMKGTITGRQGQRESIMTSPAAGYFDSDSTQYELRFVPGAPFSVVAQDYTFGGPDKVSSRGLQAINHQWLILDLPAATADVMRDLAFDTMTKLTSKTVSGKLIVPGGDAGPLGRTTVGLPRVYDRAALVGAWRKTDASGDGSSFDYQLDYVEPPNATLSRLYTIAHPLDGPSSYVVKAGAPVDGEIIDGFVAPPPFTETTHALSAPFHVDFPDAPPNYDLQLNLTDDVELRWFVQAPAGVKSFTVPALTEAMRIGLSARATNAHLLLVGEADSALDVYTKGASTGGFTVTY
jgi:hypothetical protein